jgi:hypothetical protein
MHDESKKKCDGECGKDVKVYVKGAKVYCLDCAMKSTEKARKHYHDCLRRLQDRVH